jgi:hypothetical protein
MNLQRCVAASEYKTTVVDAGVYVVMMPCEVWWELVQSPLSSFRLERPLPNDELLSVCLGEMCITMHTAGF